MMLLVRTLALGALFFGSCLAQNNPLIGVWQTQISDAYGYPSSVELLFTQNSFSQTSQSTAQRTYMGGPYQILNGGTLRWYIRQAYPTQTCSTVGCTPVYWPDSEGYFFKLIGSNTLLLNPSACAQNPCPLTYRRVQ